MKLIFKRMSLLLGAVLFLGACSSTCVKEETTHYNLHDFDDDAQERSFASQESSQVLIKFSGAESISPTRKIADLVNLELKTPNSPISRIASRLKSEGYVVADKVHTGDVIEIEQSYGNVGDTHTTYLVLLRGSFKENSMVVKHFIARSNVTGVRYKQKISIEVLGPVSLQIND